MGPCAHHAADDLTTPPPLVPQLPTPPIINPTLLANITLPNLGLPANPLAIGVGGVGVGAMAMGGGMGTLGGAAPVAAMPSAATSTFVMLLNIPTILGEHDVSVSLCAHF
jgi:hypothetical protein